MSEQSRRSHVRGLALACAFVVLTQPSNAFLTPSRAFVASTAREPAGSFDAPARSFDAPRRLVGARFAPPASHGRARSGARRGGALRMMAAGGDMDPERFTEKAWEAIAAMPKLADEAQAQIVETELLLKALLDQGAQGVAWRALARAGADVAALVREVDRRVAAGPRVTGGSTEKTMGPRLQRVLKAAEPLRTQYGDDYVAVEHLLRALLAEDDVCTRPALKSAGLGDNADATLKDAIAGLRGSKTVTSRTPEATYEALEKYSRDLTAAARAGELDPRRRSSPYDGYSRRNGIRVKTHPLLIDAPRCRLDLQASLTR